MVYRKTLMAIGALWAMVAAPAEASVTLNFGGGNSSLSGSAGNTLTFSGGGGLQVQASAWSYNGTTLGKAYLGWYGNGLGVTNGNEGNGGSNTHAIDNSGQRDFILLIFNQAVTLTSGVLTPYQQVSNIARDNDATISVTSSANLFSSGAGSLLPSASLFGTLSSNQWNVSGNTAGNFATNFLSGSKSGNVWLVGARGAGGDSNPDGFKLTSVLVSPVPEPGTWLTMLLGFAVIGTSMRRRRSAKVPQLV